MTTHAESNSREYQSWWRMKQNCQAKNYPGYRNHGAKGIKVCPEWSDFIPFLQDMGQMPNDCNALTRLDKTLDFCKINCRWGFVTQGRPRGSEVKKPRKMNRKNRIKKPKTICITLEQAHYDYIHSQAMQMTHQAGKIIQANDLIREGLQKQFPCPELFDMFGVSK